MEKALCLEACVIACGERLAAGQGRFQPAPGSGCVPTLGCSVAAGALGAVSISIIFPAEIAAAAAGAAGDGANAAGWASVYGNPRIPSKTKPQW
jgi:hypothetical protein